MNRSPQSLALFILMIVGLSAPALAGLLGLLGGATSGDGPGVPQTLKTRAYKIYDALMAYDGQFAGRNSLIHIYIKIKKDWLKVNPLPEKVILGKGDWLYLADYGTVDDCRRITPFTQPDLEILRRSSEETAETLRTNGIKFMLVIAPDKHTVYPEYLPDTVTQLNPRSRFDQFSEAMEGVSFPYLDLRPALLTARKERLLYLTKDSHWNDQGAFIGYTEIIEMTKELLPDIHQVTLTECKVYEGGNDKLDLAKLLGASDTFSEPAVRIEPTNHNNIRRTSAAVTFYPPGQKRNPNFAFTLENADLPDAPRAVIFRDSFSDAMIPFLARSFSSVTFVSYRTVDVPFVLATKPDIVIVESVERHIDLLKNR